MRRKHRVICEIEIPIHVEVEPVAARVYATHPSTDARIGQTLHRIRHFRESWASMPVSGGKRDTGRDALIRRSSGDCMNAIRTATLITRIKD